MHVDDDAMAAFIGGQLPAAEQSVVRAHLDGCPDCMAIMIGAAKHAPRGRMQQERGRLAEARPLLERALAIREAKLGAEHPQVARTAANLGYLLLDQRAYAHALAQFERVGAILAKTLPPDHPARADDLAAPGSR